MTYGNKEMEDIKRRLDALEQQDLLIVKNIGRLIFRIEIRIAGRFLEAGKEGLFLELWGKKVDAALENLEGSQTIENAFNVIHNFEGELGAYMRADKVDTADKAMEIAHSFIKKYSPVALPLKAVKEGDTWLVDIDVGALAVKIANVKVDARTGDILSYEIPTRDSKGS